MGQQIIRQPDGKFAIFSSTSDVGCIIVYDADADEIVEWFAEQAAKSARVQATRALEHVAAGEPDKTYHQFALTWEEVLKLDREHDGTAWKSFS
ncbi:hypothetical protein NQK81_01480 [Amycolatopsis roodepoortensis]|uniref:hypothetical protein n=1 Tax=Amycolatopsis roodepoortensis TaxID=700274 RepID=UPI00214C43FF|nr:hypothetical protein [Amycolatopsis roodepoortensis]UUV32147.1 hypothetical protein NQK81_01480 [Amycolatopsis roodepoortensis]